MDKQGILKKPATRASTPNGRRSQSRNRQRSQSRPRNNNNNNFVPQFYYGRRNGNRGGRGNGNRQNRRNNSNNNGTNQMVRAMAASQQATLQTTKAIAKLATTMSKTTITEPGMPVSDSRRSGKNYVTTVQSAVPMWIRQYCHKDGQQCVAVLVPTPLKTPVTDDITNILRERGFEKMSGKGVSLQQAAALLGVTEDYAKQHIGDQPTDGDYAKLLDQPPTTSSATTVKQLVKPASHTTNGVSASSGDFD